MKKHVIHIITELDPGGTEKQLAMILPYLQSSFNNEVICLMGKGSVGQVLEKKGIKVYYCRARGWFDPRMWLKTFQIVRKQHPQVLVTYLFHADMVGRLIGWLLRTPRLICSQRTNLMRYGFLWTFLEKHSHRMIDDYVVQTNVMRGILMSGLKIYGSLLHIIPNAVIPLQLSNKVTAKQKYNFEPDDLIMTCVANLKPGKGHLVLLSAFEQLHHRYPRIRLLLIGSGPNEKEIRRKLGTMNSSSHIHLMGYRQDISNLLSATDIFVLPTEREGMSNAILEAMAAGLPCVITDIPVNRELVSDGRTGLLFDYKDARHLCQKLDQLITNEVLRQEIGKAAQQYTQVNHSLQVVADRWLQLINKEPKR